MDMTDDLIRTFGDLDEENTLETVQKLKEEGVDPMEILSALQEGLTIVGDRFAKQEYFLTELMMSADLFKDAADILGDLFVKEQMTSLGTMVIGTVLDDIHDIGKNLVTTLMTCNGFKVHDIGINMHPDKFLDAIREHKPDFVGLSCLLTSTFENMKLTVAAIRKSGLDKDLKIIIGGGPVDESVRVYTGADYYCQTAQDGVLLCKELLSTDGSCRALSRGGK